ncbi:hypothetical protein TNCV_509571 [Trichonephila clavipes]|nr:hypothetical protein TNCV_509571 [Trichonephila clavipes]
MWDAKGRQVAGRNYPPTNKNYPHPRALTEEWDKLPQQLLPIMLCQRERGPEEKRTRKRGKRAGKKTRAGRFRKRRGESQSFLFRDADQNPKRE